MLAIIYYDVTYYSMSAWKQKYAAIKLMYVLLFNNKLMNEAGYLMKIKEGVSPRWITPCKISILILHMIRMRNSIVVLLFIQNNS